MAHEVAPYLHYWPDLTPAVGDKWHLGVGVINKLPINPMSKRIFVKLALDMMKEGGKRNNH